LDTLSHFDERPVDRFGFAFRPPGVGEWRCFRLLIAAVTTATSGPVNPVTDLIVEANRLEAAAAEAVAEP
jgi:hypothetical protein